MKSISNSRRSSVLKQSLFFAGLILLVLCLGSCKAKRCKCTTVRPSEPRPAVGLEPKGSHSSCSELDAEWLANDDSGEMIKKTCVEEE